MPTVWEDPGVDEVDRKHDIELQRRTALGSASEYVRRRLLPALGIAGTTFRLEIPGDGVRSLTFFVLVEGGPRLVLRCVKSLKDSQWLGAAIDVFVEHGLPAPRQAHRDAGLWAHVRWGFAAFTEDLVAGKPAGPDLSEAELEGLGTAYGRVHATESRRSGKPHRLGGGDVVAERLEWLHRLARETAVRLPGLGGALDAETRALSDARPRPPELHSLCHNRVTQANVIVRPDASVLLIDLERVKFGSHLHELALLEAEVLAGSEQAFEGFLRGYARSTPDRLLPEAQAAAWAWHRRAVRLKRARDAAVAGDAERARRALGSGVG